jgi:hypothetical protein
LQLGLVSGVCENWVSLHEDEVGIKAEANESDRPLGSRSIFATFQKQLVQTPLETGYPGFCLYAGG